MKASLQPIANFLQGEVIEELNNQNHVASGKLRDSIEVNVIDFVGGFKVVGTYLHYGEYVDKGRKAGVKKVPINALIEWMRLKKFQLNGKKERSVAFAIQTAIFKKGSPTDGDDKKKRFISRTLEDNEIEIRQMIESVFYSIVELAINNMIEDNKKQLI